MWKRHLAAFVGCVILSATGVFAQSPPATGFRAEFFRLYDDANTKLVRLAEAMPAEKFTWRPMEGVRSVAEVYTHLSLLNYNMASLLGTPIPEGITPASLNAITEKAGVVKVLKDSFQHTRAVVENLSDADLEKPVRLGQRQTVFREVLLILVSGHREHLGQSVAYARVNQVVPPWTAERQAQQPAKRQ